MWIVSWDPFLMKKLLKNDIYESMNSTSVHCSWTHKLQFLTIFSLKMDPTILFTYLKIILLQYFSIFNCIQTDPKSQLLPFISSSIPLNSIFFFSKPSSSSFFKIQNPKKNKNFTYKNKSAVLTVPVPHVCQFYIALFYIVFLFPYIIILKINK